MPYVVDAHREPLQRNLTCKKFFSLFEQVYAQALADPNSKKREVRAITGFGSNLQQNGEALGGKICEAMEGCLKKNQKEGRLDYKVTPENPGMFVIYPKGPLLPRDAPPVLDDASKGDLKDQIVRFVGTEGKSIAEIQQHFKSPSVTERVISQCVNTLCKNNKHQKRRLRSEGGKLKQI